MDRQLIDELVNDLIEAQNLIDDAIGLLKGVAHSDTKNGPRHEWYVIAALQDASNHSINSYNDSVGKWIDELEDLATQLDQEKAAEKEVE